MFLLVFRGARMLLRFSYYDTALLVPIKLLKLDDDELVGPEKKSSDRGDMIFLRAFSSSQVLPNSVSWYGLLCRRGRL